MLVPITLEEEREGGGRGLTAPSSLPLAQHMHWQKQMQAAGLMGLPIIGAGAEQRRKEEECTIFRRARECEAGIWEIVLPTIIFEKC